MVDTVTIQKINEVWMKVTCNEPYMEMDISDHFQFEVANAQYDPRVKFGHWDGIKRLYNRKTKRMHCGLLFELLKLADKQGWKTNIDPLLVPEPEQIEDEDLDELIRFVNPHSDGNPIDPYDYQREAVKYMLNMDRSTVLAATSAGKSLIIYIAIRIYQLMDEMEGKRIFITVPSKALVEQLYNDFEDYSNFEGSNWSPKSFVQKISGDYSKRVDMPIVITTWQSMQKLPHWIFEDMGAIFIDETHTASASVLTGILEKAINTKHRHGLTGTLDEVECNQLVIQGLLGPAKRIVTARELIDQGRAAEIIVRMSMIDYPESFKKELYDVKKNINPKKGYTYEIETINENEYRRKFILSMVKSMPGNSLVLFDRVDKYGEELYEEFKKYHENTFLIVGKVSATEREKIRVSMEEYEDAVIFASFGTMQQGISIKKLKNMFIISSSKSIVRILQSIGRMMRVHKEYKNAMIFDIVDDLSYDGKPNYCLKHAEERVRFYNNEQFIVKFDKYDIRKFMNDLSIDDFIS